MYEVTGTEELEIVGIKILPTENDIDFYIFNINGERPAYVDKRLIIFHNINNASLALKHSNCGAAILRLPEPLTMSYRIDVLQTIKAFQYQNECAIIDSSMRTHPETMELCCMNLLTDYFYDTETDEEREKDPIFHPIERAAMNLFATNSLSEYTREHRITIVNSILLLIGKIMTTAFFVDVPAKKI